MASVISAVPNPALGKTTVLQRKSDSNAKHKISPSISLFSGGVAGAVEAAVTVSAHSVNLEVICLFSKSVLTDTL